MPDYGLTDAGFLAKTAAIIRDEVDDELRTAFGASVPLGDKTALGQLSGIVAGVAGDVWELGEALHAARDPDQATGSSQDAVCAISGTLREGARESTTTLTLTGTDGTAVPALSRATSESTPTTVFATDADATLLDLDVWANTTAYVLGDRRSNAGNSYIVITAGTSAGSGGPDTEDDDITDGTVHWRFMGAGTAAIDVAATATETGPLVAVSGDVTEIVTPVGGWSSVINLEDAEVGANIETDASLRERREEELAQPGSAPVDALRNAILDVEGVTYCHVFVNDTDTTDGDGIPPHAVEVAVIGGADQDLWDALLANVAAGIQTYGTEEGTATDSQGTEHDEAFTRIVEVPIYIDYTIDVDADAYLGAAEFKLAAKTYLTARAQVGRNVTVGAVTAAAFSADGVEDVTDVDLDDSATPAAAATVAIGPRQIATFDTSNITVVSTPVTP